MITGEAGVDLTDVEDREDVVGRLRQEGIKGAAVIGGGGSCGGGMSTRVVCGD